jgi:hypothetical protein
MVTFFAPQLLPCRVAAAIFVGFAYPEIVITRFLKYSSAPLSTNRDKWIPVVF